MKKLEEKEIRKIQLELLEKIYAFCNKKDLKLYLSGGTLIGAILYKGFIPWDDDIDLNMPREDYDKLLKLKNSKDFPQGMSLLDCENDKTYIFPFAKLIKNNTYVNENVNTNDREFGVWIDIFPFDGAPNDKKEQHRLINKMKFLFYLVHFSSYKIGSGATIFRKIVKLLPLIILKVITPNRISCYLNKVARRVRIGDTKYVGLIVSPTNYGEIFPFEGYLQPTDIIFENKKYKASSNYDIYIKNRYGKITLDVPKEKRINHDYIAYYRG